MTYGNCRVTVLDPQCRPYVSDVKEGDIWYFPSGLPHSLQGLAPGGCEFILCFDDGKASEFNTLLLTDWIAHTPPEVLAKNFDAVDAGQDYVQQNQFGALVVESSQPFFTGGRGEDFEALRGQSTADGPEGKSFIVDDEH